MRVLVIPDVHLKPWMFRRASELMKETESDRAVCLMDIADDWQQQFNLDLYIQTYDAAIDFAKEYPVTLWCYGNHFRMSGSWLIFTGSTMSCSPMAVWRMHLSAGMFRPANITTLTRSSTRSMDSAAEKCGRMPLLSGIGRSITKGGFISQGSFCR